MKGLRVNKIVKEIKFEGVWGELESRGSLQAQSVSRYLGLALVFSCGAARSGGGAGGLISVQGFFASVNEMFILAGGLRARLSFYGV